MRKTCLLVKLSLIILQVIVAAVAKSNGTNELMLLRIKKTTTVYGVSNDLMVHLYYYGKKLNNTTGFKNYETPPVSPTMNAYAGRTFTELTF